MKLIDKDALVAEIERLVGSYKPLKTLDPTYCEGLNDSLDDILSFIGTLEVNEVEEKDLEKEINLWFDYGLPNNDELLDYIKETAKHFYELGLKKTKGE